MGFGEVLEAVEELPLEDQAALLEVLHWRVAERRRAELAADIQEAQREFQTDQYQPTTAAALMKEILS